MKKQIGDLTPNGSTYKVDFNERQPIGIDDEIRKQYLRIENYKINSEKYITKHNQLVKVREEVATTPDEYMRNGLKTISAKECRELIIMGCDREIDDCIIQLSKINDNFKQYYRE